MKTKINKNFVAIASALMMQLSGIALAVAAFVRSPTGEISDSVLWYVGQTLIYSGSIFGVSVYVQTKVAEIRNEILGGNHKQ